MKKLQWRAFLLGAVGGLIFLLCIEASLVSAKQTSPAKPSFVPDRVLVSFRPGSTKSVIRAVHSQAGGRIVKILDRIGVQVIEVPSGTVLDTIKKYKNNRNILFAEPNYQRSLFLPATNEGSETDPVIANNFNEQWHLDNTGHSFGAIKTLNPDLTYDIIAPAYTGIANADIDALAGWAITHGSADIHIAVIDSGVSCAH
ncbi:MAG: hypothetical protein D3924_08035, partial [Candidatus Electrothrix sp. AR4]|nr:hypothetical protein [Candidatus Electrothrix sp. AR4]